MTKAARYIIVSDCYAKEFHTERAALMEAKRLAADFEYDKLYVARVAYEVDVESTLVVKKP